MPQSAPGLRSAAEAEEAGASHGKRPTTSIVRSGLWPERPPSPAELSRGKATIVASQDSAATGGEPVTGQRGIGHHAIGGLARTPGVPSFTVPPGGWRALGPDVRTIPAKGHRP